MVEENLKIRRFPYCTKAEASGSRTTIRPGLFGLYEDRSTETDSPPFRFSSTPVIISKDSCIQLEIIIIRMIVTSTIND